MEGLGHPQGPAMLPGVLSKVPYDWQRPQEGKEAAEQLAKEGYGSFPGTSVQCLIIHLLLHERYTTTCNYYTYSSS